MGRYEESLENLNKSLEIESNNAIALNNHGITCGITCGVAYEFKQIIRNRT